MPKKKKKKVRFYVAIIYLFIVVRPLVVIFGIVHKHLDPIRQDILYI